MELEGSEGAINGTPEGVSAPMDLDIAAICYKARQKAPKKGPNAEPTNWKQAIKSPDSEKWIEATFSELEQLLRASTFQFTGLSEVPNRRKLLKNRMHYRLKKDKYNRPLKWKARLVAKGFMQIEGLDFLETFAITSIPPS